jgi:hypothetical protein
MEERVRYDGWNTYLRDVHFRSLSLKGGHPIEDDDAGWHMSLLRSRA